MASRILQLVKQSYGASTTDSYIERLCTSWILSPILLFAFRATISVYAFTVLFTSIGYESTHDMTAEVRHDFSYFTILGYWGLAFYFAFAAAHTGSYIFRGRAFLQSWPSVLKWLHSTFYATITVFPFVVTAVFWTLLSKGAFSTQFNAWDNISEHALNSALAFSEILLPRSDPHPWLQLIPLIVILALYLGLAYLTHATEHFYVYSFLNPANGSGLVAGAVVGILVAAILVFIIVRYLILFRRWVTESKLGLHGKFPTRAKAPGEGKYEHGEQMEELGNPGVRTVEDL